MSKPQTSCRYCGKVLYRGETEEPQTTGVCALCSTGEKITEIDAKLLTGDPLTPEEALYRIYHILAEWSDGQDWANECESIAMQTLNHKRIRV